MNWGRTALHLTPDAALVLFTLGLLLIYLELNRPGAVLPGAFGLAISLLSIASLLRLNLNAAALVLTLTSIVLLLLGLFRSTSSVVAIAATLALCLGLDRLVAGPGQPRIHAFAAVPCGIVLGTVSSILTRIARRARANKAVD